MIFALLAWAALGQEVQGEAVAADGVLSAELPALVGPDRSKPPDVPAPERLDLPEAQVYRLSPAVEVLFVPVEGVRRVGVSLIQHRGTVELGGGWPTPAAGWTLGQMGLGTESLSAMELELRKDLHEIELSVGSGHHSSSARMSVPKEELDVGLETLREVLTRPAYPKRDLRRNQRDMRLWFEVTGPNHPDAVARNLAVHAWWPADHPYGARPDLPGMLKIKPQTLQALHQRWLRSGPVTVVVAGDITWDELEPRLRTLVEGLGQEGEWSEPLEVTPPSAGAVLASDLPGMEQVKLTLRIPAPALHHEDRLAYEVLTHALGGHFLSRLNANLREDKGYTYGSSAHHSASETYGLLQIQVDVAAPNTGAAITEIEHELRRVVEAGITAEEINQAWRASLSSWNRIRATAGSALGFYARQALRRTPVAEAAEELDRKRTFTPADIQAVAETWLADEGPRIWTIVGPRSEIAPQLEERGWEVRWIPPSEAFLGSF